MNSWDFSFAYQHELPQTVRFTVLVTADSDLRCWTCTLFTIDAKFTRRVSDTIGSKEILLLRLGWSEAGMSRAVNVLALVRDGQRYIFLYDDSSVQQVLSQLAEFAADSELDFTWHDAAILSQRVRDLQSEEASLETEDFPTFF